MKHATGRPVINSIAYNYPPNDVVSNRILSSFPQLVPVGFKISHFPKEVNLFACQAIHIFELSLIQKQKGELNHRTESGRGEAFSARSSFEEKIPCLTEYRRTKTTSSYRPSLKYAESQTSVLQAVLLKNVRF